MELLKKSIEERKELTDEWHRSGVKEGVEQIRHIVRKSIRLSVAARRKRGRMTSMEQ